MARFIFKLDGVLQHRERIEQEHQRALAVVTAELVRLQGDMRNLTDEVNRNAADVRDNHLVGKLNMSYLAAHRRYMLGMQRRLQNSSQAIAAQQQVVEAARAELAEATKQKKILEKLRERYHERWKAEQARLEAGALDELSTQMSYAAAREPEVAS
jgi:flagellar FliJ protein